LTFAISLDRIFDGFRGPFFGFVSDTIGREYTIFIAFGTAALMLLRLSAYGHITIVFVLSTAVYFGVGIVGGLRRSRPERVILTTATSLDDIKIRSPIDIKPPQADSISSIGDLGRHV